MSRRVDLALGVVFLLLVAAGLGTAALLYDKAFTDRTEVVLATGTVGNALQQGSDVKLNGVPVGEVTDIEATSDGARLTLALEPDVASGLPDDTVARLLPKTLFGERYVQLLADGATSGGGISEGGTIRQDGSDEAVELEEVLDELLPVLRSIQPAKLAATLGELTLLLRGQGAEIGESMRAWAGYLDDLDPYVPTLTADLQRLAEVADVYDVAAPDLLGALDDLTVTAATLVERRTTLEDLYAGVITAAGESESWLEANRDTIVVLADDSRAALAAVEPYAAQFPCLFRSVADFEPVMEEVLGVGTAEPGLHVTLDISSSRGAYRPGRDQPSYLVDGSPRCPYTVGSRSSAAPAPSGADPAAIAPPAGDVVASYLTAGNAPQLALAAGLGEANSPAENQLIAELLAPGAGLAPADYPAWGSLLVGPVLRGTEVTLR
ncbi:MCE family protein [Nocardioides sp. CPCC 205120]|uniref:MCE family protein n=1 Tax=Nocardioides sp. CPCC 205120 TaxID=3406462 RepID=UPI003B508CD6